MNIKSESKTFHLIFDERAEINAGLVDAVEKVRKKGHTVVMKKIADPREAVRYAAAAAEQDVNTVVAVGGDGMLNRVINGIQRSRGTPGCAVGLIPFGTGNDFAGASGIPCDNPRDALDVVVETIPVPIDVGQVNQSFFVNVVTGGFPAEAAAETTRNAKDLLGKFSYLLTGLANIGDLAAKYVRFKAPGFEWKGAVYAFALGNGRQAGGGFTVASKAVIDDGLLDLMIIPESKEGLIPLVSEYLRLTRFEPTDRIVCVQVPRLDLVSREIIHLNLDGEPVEGREFRFTVHARRLPFCLPENSPMLTPPSAGD